MTTDANLTGPVTSVGNATTITNGAVTYGKIQNETNNTLLGNVSGSTASPEELTLGSGINGDRDDIERHRAPDWDSRWRSDRNLSQSDDCEHLGGRQRYHRSLDGERRIHHE